MYYASKEDLVHATYLEIKAGLADAVLEQVDTDAEPRERYRQMWMATYAHLRSQPERARFLTQYEASPFHESARQLLLEQGDRLLEEASRPDIAALLEDLPMIAVYLPSIGAAVRAVSSDIALTNAEIDTLVDATWQAVTIEG